MVFTHGCDDPLDLLQDGPRVAIVVIPALRDAGENIDQPLLLDVTLGFSKNAHDRPDRRFSANGDQVRVVELRRM